MEKKRNTPLRSGLWRFTHKYLPSLRLFQPSPRAGPRQRPDLPPHLHPPFPGGRRALLNPGHVLQAGLICGKGRKQRGPGARGFRSRHQAGQVVVVEHQRPFLRGFRLLVLPTLLLLTLQPDLGIERKGRGGGDTAPGSPFSSELFLQVLIIKWLLFIEHLLHASKALWRHLFLILQVGKVRLRKVEQPS